MTLKSINEINVLDNGFVKLVDIMGSDLTAVNAARCSFAANTDFSEVEKVSKLKSALESLDKNKFEAEYPKSKYTEEYINYLLKANKEKVLKPKDFKLLKYLIKEKHHSPLRHSHIKFHVKVPLVVNGQWIKHQVACNYSGEGWNQISHRYIDGSKEKTKFDFYFPTTFRLQSEDNRQASLDETVNPFMESEQWREYGDFSRDYNETGEVLRYTPTATEVFKAKCLEAVALYEDLVRLGVSKEQARMVIPQNVYTEFIWTTSLQAVLNFIKLRKHTGAQYEIRQYAEALESIVGEIFPASMYLWETYGE